MVPIYEINLPELGCFYLRFYYSQADDVKEPHDYAVHVDDSVELFVLEEGDVSFLVGGKLYELMPGDVVLSKPNEIHNCIQNSRCVHKHFCFWFSPACEVLLSDFSKHPDGKGNLIRLLDAEKKQLLALCHRIYEQAKEGKTVSAYSTAVAILELCRGGLYLLPEAQAMPKELITVLQTMDTRMETIRSIKDLCEELFMSQSTLLRLFRRFLGVSPHEYLEARRLAMARNYLKEGKSVTETSLLTGFADTSAFIRLFRQRFGLTPLKYRQMNIKE